MKSILHDKSDYKCYLCGRCGTSMDPLDEHHVFGGPYRKLSEKYGLKVYIHHRACHIFNRRAIHNDAERNNELKAEVQKIAMEYYGWTKEEWIALFGRNYRSDI